MDDLEIHTDCGFARVGKFDTSIDQILLDKSDIATNQ